MTSFMITAFILLCAFQTLAHGISGTEGTRIIRGLVVNDRNVAISQVRILVIPDQPFNASGFSGNPLTGRADPHGEFSLDISDVDWARGPLRVMVTAPGYSPRVNIVPAVPEAAALHFTLSPNIWALSSLRLVNSTGTPIAGAEVTLRIDDIPLETTKSDDNGDCKLAVPANFPHLLSVEQVDSRPVRIFRGIASGEPDSLTVALLPEIRGRVKGPDSKPPIGVVIGKRFIFIDGKPGLVSFLKDSKPLKLGTDRDGLFKLPVPYDLDGFGKPRKPVEVICFADEKFKNMSMIEVTNGVLHSDLSINLAPARKIRIPIEVAGLVLNLSTTVEFTIYPEIQAHRTVVYAVGQNGGSELASSGTNSRDLEAILPSGRYKVSVEHPECTGSAIYKIDDGFSPITLPSLKLTPSAYQIMVGKSAPEIDARDLVTGKTVRLSSLRGKVIVLDFWGYWCGPCTIGLVELMKVKESLANQPVEFFALHDASVQSKDEYDVRIKNVRDKLWGGHDISFGVLIDEAEGNDTANGDRVGTGKTIRRYGITAFPTTLVIDQRGVVVGRVTNPEKLELMIRKLLVTPSAND